ncbi:hypothetical protein BT63DRAFT_424333 [Microthyrium microscopicum]|uniref:GST C-terminal domain-containing protein n=1 Tax=Microthyrium microscopicum TaxID=703497 RepID=A0A6A6UF22_9PEZI|nr:hypothetical protein BT63DRAFT_424333 [Microthyrium microscopicum]
MTETKKASWRAGDYADGDGRFRRPDSVFRDFVSPDPNSPFPAEDGRYVLYVHYGCPWAHRTIITRALKGLEDVVQLVELDGKDAEKGWEFTGTFAADKDPLYGFRYLRQFYEKVAPGYTGIVTVPMLWDKKTETIVNNESSEIIRMFYSAFDEFLPVERREETKGEAGLFAPHLRADIEAMNNWVYNTINNGVYKCGFASTQEAYDEHVYTLFKSLNRVEEHLSKSANQPYLFGKNITEADIRLYTTMARFDVAYYTIFKCNLKMIRHDYPNIHQWLRNLYWDESETTNGGAFKNTTKFELYKPGYTLAIKAKIIPAGPDPYILPL